MEVDSSAAQAHHLALPQGTMLFEFRIDGMLGHGGFGITYLATDTNLQESVAIKEYFPNDMAYRDSTATVLPKSDGEEEDFDAGLTAFLEEARTLARFRHPRIVHVRRFFEQNGTGYIVFEFVKGRTLSQRLAEGNLPENQFRRIFDGILEALDFLHEHAILHRDLKPNNIMLRDDGAPVIIDFGAARDFSARHSRSVTAIATAGYSPPEQYGAGGDNGPWTDLYALGGIAYRFVTGQTPPDSLRRLRNDPYVPAATAARGRFDETFLHTIDRMLRIEETERPASVDEVRRMLSGEVPRARPPDAPRLVDLTPAAGGLMLLQFDRPIESEQLELSLFAAPPGDYLSPSVNQTTSWLKAPHYFRFPRSKASADRRVFEIPREIAQHVDNQAKVTIASRDGAIEETRIWTAPRQSTGSPILRRSLAAAVIVLALVGVGGGGYFGWRWWQEQQAQERLLQEVQRLTAALDAAGSDRATLEQFIAQCTAPCTDTLKAEAQKRLAALPPLRPGTPAPPQLSPELARWVAGADRMSVREIVQRATEPGAIYAVAVRRLAADNYQDAMLLFEEAGERGNGAALTALARMYDPNGFVPGKPFRNPDARKAAQYYKAAVGRGEPSAAAPREALRIVLDREARSGNRMAAATLKDYWP
jgi:serine/threonine protein kinase